MAVTIPIGETNVPANAFTQNLDAVQASDRNPVTRTTKVSVYAVANVTEAIQYGLQIGGVNHGLANAPLSAALALSTRDNKILEGWALPGQRIALSRRELGGVATTDTAGVMILE